MRLGMVTPRWGVGRRLAFDELNDCMHDDEDTPGSCVKKVNGDYTDRQHCLGRYII